MTCPGVSRSRFYNILLSLSFSCPCLSFDTFLKESECECAGGARAGIRQGFLVRADTGRSLSSIWLPGPLPVMTVAAHAIDSAQDLCCIALTILLYTPRVRAVGLVDKSATVKDKIHDLIAVDYDDRRESGN